MDRKAFFLERVFLIRAPQVEPMFRQENSLYLVRQKQ